MRRQDGRPVSGVAGPATAGEDAWRFLSRYTDARIGLGRAGGSRRTSELLAFRLAHAAAIDAVAAALPAADLEKSLSGLGLGVVTVASAARDRAEYLADPGLGRCLDEKSRHELAVSCSARGGVQTPDLALIVADGLSAAATRHAATVLATLCPGLTQSGISSSPVVLVRLGRVAIQDEIGALLGARMALILIGERPGLQAADSLGAYLVHGPRAGRTDADRNCVSNIRPGGLEPAVAAGRIHWLVTESLRRGLSGVELKDGSMLISS